ncbi:hypothetical protein NQ314_019495, partial [Rhamnusium bicolor]
VDTDSLTAVVHGVILGVPMPFELPNPDGCKDSGVSCPVTVDIKWELRDHDEKDVICALIPSKIG